MELDNYLEQTYPGYTEGNSPEVEELLITATTCPDCGGNLSGDTCSDCKMDWSNYAEIEDARRKLDNMGIDYE